MDVAGFRKLPVIGILRGVELGCLEPLIETVISSGLKTIEITMNTKDAALLIRRAVKVSAKRLSIGAGTVLDLGGLESALDAGATFIVSPLLVKDVTEYCVKNEIPVFPGALTPLEVYNAWQSGATMVKVFPAKVFGPEYFRELKGPFNDIQLLACGGVTPENMRSYFENGASAVTFGASVFKKELLEKKDFKGIGLNITRYLSGFNGISNTGG